MAADFFEKEQFLVLDGGLATELTRAGFNLDVSQLNRVERYPDFCITADHTHSVDTVWTVRSSFYKGGKLSMDTIIATVNS